MTPRATRPRHLSASDFCCFPSPSRGPATRDKLRSTTRREFYSGFDSANGVAMRRVGVLVALAIGWLPGCEARQGGVEKGHTAPSRQVENASVTAPKQAEPAEPAT